MFDKPLCRCPRCIARRRNLLVAVSGFSIAVAVGYLGLADRRETVADPSLGAIGGSATGSSSNRTPLPAADSAPVSKDAPELRTAKRQQESDVADKQSQFSPRDLASTSVQHPIEKNPQLAVTGRDEKLETLFGSDSYGLLPTWLTKNNVEVPRKPHWASAVEGKRMGQNRENAAVNPAPGGQPALTSASLQPKIELFEATILLAGSKDASNRGGTSAPDDKSQPGATPTVSVPHPAEPLPPRPKTTSPLSQSTPKPAFAIESKPAPQLAMDPGSEPKLVKASASFVAIQENDLLKETRSPEHGGPQGYITLESKPESIRNAPGRNRSPRTPEHRPTTENDPVEPLDNPLYSHDDQSKRGDASVGPGNESSDLQRFALDFVRTEQSGSVGEQHRFYAESVHFYGEGDLSWAGVAAATRRHHEGQNRQFGATARATVKGPVDGGFYVVDQPVSWSRTDGSRLSRGRSMLRLRVISTGRGGWKITSIEEVGQ